ncbi:MAG: hypothetical protein GF421_01140 [Candidatus Aminicenantes bacterium]|nr:hypothetical protein [Candidatus Aminicenantes bacterium]
MHENKMVMEFIGILLGIILLTGFSILIRFLKKAKSDIQKKIAQRYQGHHIVLKDNSANFFGKGSLKSKQVRGNGILILTEDEIYFSMFLPRKEIIVPLHSIQNIETPKSFLGKTKFKPLLKISFEACHGVQDSAAWLVRDVEKWKKEIQNRIPKQRKEAFSL